ncbi:(-)-alpha-terpineol synthase-like [Nymphaea colorata]|nr:(-)-alpha-terpineol synthase-like [Nymphaea colorata]
MAVGKMHEPQFSQYRMQFARVSYLMATVEDIFGEHQSVQELECFVQVVERWDLQAAEQLPQSLRVFYAAVYNTTNQISYTVLRRHGRDITSHMRRAWVSVCRDDLVEARWHHAQQTPRLEEHLSNIRAAMTSPILLPAYFFLSQNIEEQSIQQLQSESNIINLSSMIVRLSADLQRSRSESESVLRFAHEAAPDSGGSAIAECGGLLKNKKEELTLAMPNRRPESEINPQAVYL